MENNILIVGSCRTAIGNMGRGLAPIGAVDLGTSVIKEVIRRSGLKPADVEEVMMGNVISAGLGLCPARQAALAAGIPESSPALDVGMVCASGLRAVALATEAVRRGSRDVVVAGGAESMSNAPRLVRLRRSGKDVRELDTEEALLGDGLMCPVGHEHMGMTAERLAEELSIPRGEQDEFAYRSHMKAAAAEEDLSREIVPVAVPRDNGDTIQFDVDEQVRPKTSLEKLAALEPVFKENGTVTAGNASGLSDGAAAVTLVSGIAAAEKGLAPVAKVTGWATAGVDPARMGLGPVPATLKLCDKLGMEPNDFDLVELNEAFAVQSLAVIRELGLSEDRVNIRGGAVALGHPLGCTGARILVTLIHAMQDRNAKKGLATLCVGTGMGMSLALELL